MHSTDNERKSVIAEKFIRTLQNRIYKYTTSVLKNVYNDKPDDIVNKCNDIYHSTIKMKPVDIKPNTYIDSSKEINNKYPKSKIVDIFRISQNKNVFAKGYTPNWTEKSFVN